MEFINNFIDLLDDLISAVPTLLNSFTSGIASLMDGAKVLPSIAVLLPSAVLQIFCGMFAVILFTVCLKAILARF